MPSQKADYDDILGVKREASVMRTLLKKVAKILKKDFPHAIVEIQLSSDGRKIGGFLTWSGFEGKDHITRQEILRDKLALSLSHEEFGKVTTIFAMTPDEVLVED